MVIDALITTRILVQFIGQVVALTLLRRRAPDLPRRSECGSTRCEPGGVLRLDLPVRDLGWQVIAFGLARCSSGGAFFAWSGGRAVAFAGPATG